MKFFKKKQLLFIFLCLSTLYSFGQTYQLKGRVADEYGFPINGVMIQSAESEQHTYTDENGDFYFEKLGQGRNTFKLSYAGEKLKIYVIDLESDAVLAEDWVLEISAVHLETAVIQTQIQNKEIETLPTEIVSSEFLRKHSGGSLMQSLERLPGIKSISIGSSTSKPLIRGLGFNQVTVVENGVKHEGQQWGADHGLEIDQYNVNDLEIIKGPASFIYGSDAIGGTININSIRKPRPDSFGGSVDLIGKSNNGTIGSSLNLYARTGNWYFNARSTFLDYGDYTIPADTVYSYSYAVRLKDRYVRNTAGSELNNSVSIGYTDRDFSTVFFLSNNFTKSGFFANAHGLEPRNVDESLHDASNRDILLPYQQVNHTKMLNQTEWKSGKHRFRIDAGYQRNHRKEFSYYVSHGYMPPVYPESMIYPEDLEREYDKEIWSLDIKDNILLKKHRITVGINTEIQKNSIGGWGFIIPAYDYQKFGGFVYDNYSLSKEWKLLAALRYDYGKINSKAYYDWFESEVGQSGNDVENEFLQRSEDFQRTFHSFTWAAGLKYKKKQLQLTLNIGKGFRMPIAQELASNGVNYHYFRYEKGNKTLNPEQSYQLDFGMEWTDEKLHLLFTPYLNYFSNYIYLNPTSDYDTYYGAGNQVFEYTQAEVFRTGAEFQLVYHFLPDWHFEASGEYIYNRQLTGPKKNFSLPFTPPASALFTLSFEPELNESILSKTYFNLDFRITAAQNRVTPPERKTPAYNVWGFSMGSEILIGQQEIILDFSIQNLFNTKYLNHTSFYRIIELPEPGRNFVLTLKIPFGKN